MLLLAFIISSLLAVEVLDVEMDAADKKKTGVSKLTDKEKSELQAWIDDFYTRRETPILAKTKPADKKALLMENLQNGNYIRLNDNSTWNIRPSDTAISVSWITPVDIIITQSGDPNYPVKLTNSLTGSSVLAKKVTQLPPAPAPQPSSPTTPPSSQPNEPSNPLRACFKNKF